MMCITPVVLCRTESNHNPGTEGDCTSASDRIFRLHHTYHGGHHVHAALRALIENSSDCPRVPSNSNNKSRTHAPILPRSSVRSKTTATPTTDLTLLHDPNMRVQTRQNAALSAPRGHL